jgi:hypothetical protein
MATRGLVLCTILVIVASFIVGIAATDGKAHQVAYHGIHQLVTRLGNEKARRLESSGNSGDASGLKSFYAFLFPFESPAYNSILATFYISSVPNFILALVPAELELESLNTMVRLDLCIAGGLAIISSVAPQFDIRFVL